ncbi:MAG: hypothetical protein F6J98_16090 [Moorea sp. SIO4G2]|uniref:hypothetical protein n=1 Tax=Moorena TaxID=1155738 RepID=UPI0013015205|nr:MULTISPECIES: hypothetical protein [Moorena]NEO13713.1 hypothetical protein [Moorena sp. SIO3E8]NEO61866.1 hypothetical protein [Moorena sp. SIO4G2]NEP28819.1 hypothetical protein [Moorena sp. SIO3I6]NEP98379.1 hypothetical protein [Moorena sp. SIO3F7]
MAIGLGLWPRLALAFGPRGARLATLLEVRMATLQMVLMGYVTASKPVPRYRWCF